MKKKSTKKLTKEQLKKINGGQVWCTKTECLGDTCGAYKGHSAAYCGLKDGNGSTLSVASGSISSGKVVLKK